MATLPPQGKKITADSKWQDVMMKHYSPQSVQTHDRQKQEFAEHTINNSCPTSFRITEPWTAVPV